MRSISEILNPFNRPPILRIVPKIETETETYYLNIRGDYFDGKTKGDLFFIFYAIYKNDSYYYKNPMHWVKENHVPYGVGRTIDAAYIDFINNLKKNPLK